jgi:propanol-preferring alcohol dehydrogenase
MKAVVMAQAAPVEDGALQVVEIERPTPGPGQVLLRVTACGVCRSNLHMIEGDWLGAGVPTKLPIVPGHEAVGVVAEVGEGVDDLQEGDRVGVQPLWSTCGHCRFCLSGLDHLCQSKEITGETLDGGYAEYMLATAAHAHKIPDGLDDAEAAPLFCPGITAYGSVAKAKLGPGRRVAVFGVGGVGHMVIQFAALTGADVIAVSRGAEHRELARELGAVETIDASAEDPGEVLSAQGGVDAAIVFAPSDAAVEQAIRGTRPGGTIVIGINAAVGALPFAEEKTVVGSLLGTRQQMREVLEIAAAGKVRAQCERYPLERAGDALRDLKEGRIRARAVLVVSG